jgi:hypothetical protein
VYQMRAGIVILALVGLSFGSSGRLISPQRRSTSREDNSGWHGANTILRVHLTGKDLGSIIIFATDVPLVGQKLKLWRAATHRSWNRTSSGTLLRTFRHGP